ncbi:DUF1173 family protein [Nocardia jejuensis]|uniref:DUF1173 family protein n=1 Tax=Nocardia jejuensis TaxID=328049 RepID=UPI0012F713FE
MVCLTGHSIRLDAMRARPERYGRLAATAKTVDGHGWCLCRGEPLRLVIRFRNSRYFLARWPGEGSAHDPSCPFHQPDEALTGRAAYADTAIVEGPSGTTIRFDAPPPAAPSCPCPVPRTNSATTPAVGTARSDCWGCCTTYGKAQLYPVLVVDCLAEGPSCLQSWDHRRLAQ